MQSFSETRKFPCLAIFESMLTLQLHLKLGYMILSSSILLLYNLILHATVQFLVGKSLF